MEKMYCEHVSRTHRKKWSEKFILCVGSVRMISGLDMKNVQRDMPRLRAKVNNLEY